MMAFAIAVSTMIIVALVVCATQFNLYKKYQAKRDEACLGKGTAGEPHETPVAS